MGRGEPARIIFGAVAAARSLLASINDRENELAKLAIKPQDLEVILLEKLRSVPYCEGATIVTVHPLADTAVDTNWTIANFNPGTSGIDSCAAALRKIERDLQQVYTLRRECAAILPQCSYRLP